MRSILTIIIGTTTAWSAPVENLFGNGSFEEPKISGRTPETDAGLLSVDAEENPWLFFGAAPEEDGGKMIVGITDEIARTGKQSIYVDFEKMTAPARQAVLMTKLLPVKPAQAYRLSMWGRIDRKRPLSLDERRPFMMLDVEFVGADQETKAGEPLQGAQLIPGNIVPGGPHPLIYSARKWSEFSTQLTTPADTAFLRVTLRWVTPTDPGETDGIIYWDDATLVEENPPAAEGSGKEGKPGKPVAEPAEKASSTGVKPDGGK
jgi:hypothetical protein